LALRWFRFGKQPKDDAADTAATQEQEQEQVQVQAQAQETPPEVEAVEAPESNGASEAARKKRRRGSRGGRGRKKTGAGAQASAEVASDKPAAEKPKPAAAGKQAAKPRAERKPERKAERKPAKSRRRTPTRRAALPAAKRELLISVDVGEQRVAILEDDRVAEVYLERPERRSIAGNIYLGTVDNVLPGMEAAFVEIGLEKNGFLYVDEIVGPELEGTKGARRIQDLIKRGQSILVQAVKDPMKSKGARLTTEISLPGRFLVYVPNGDGYGVSRRLEDEERTRLKGIIKDLDAKGGGIIVRTAAEGASAEDIERDLVFLQRLWKTIEAKAKKASAPELVYEEAELPLRIVRDLFAGDFVGAQIDDERTHKRIVSYLKKTSPHMIERVHRYKEKEPLFEASGIEAEINSTLERRVDLPSGGYLVFDYAEAFTVIDVNTGRFVGSRGKSSQGRLEDTIVKNNLEAVKEVVRQLRLRDIGGIIVIDFIDMSNPKNRATVEDALRSELERDRTKTYVVEISPLGLVEMTRQNVTDGPREILTTKCAVCGGDGIVVSEATHALEVERKLRALAKGSRVQGFEVAVHPRIQALLAGPGGERLEAIEAASRRRFFLVAANGNGHVHLDQFEVLRQGKLETLAPEAPVEEGSTVELKLVEVGLHDPGAAVGKIGGYEILVAGAAKLVGKKVQAAVGRVLQGIAFATLADAAAAPAPITFEAEAEKPTRAPSRKARAGKAAAAEVEAPADEDEELTAAAVAAPKPRQKPARTAGARKAQAKTEAVEADDALEAGTVEDDGAEAPEEAVGVDGQPKKKRTRRGSRGGRGRKKTPATATTGDDDAASEAPSEAPDEVGRRPAPRIHVPTSDLAPEPAAAEAAPDEPVAEVPAEGDGSGPEAADGQPAKKRTRRGTRGGRKRKKPAAATADAGEGTDAVDAEQPVVVAEVAAEPEPEPAPANAEPVTEPAEYVPMSEWIEDFNRRAPVRRSESR
jgi:ribonuclease G